MDLKDREIRRIQALSASFQATQNSYLGMDEFTRSMTDRFENRLQRTDRDVFRRFIGFADESSSLTELDELKMRLEQLEREK